MSAFMSDLLYIPTTKKNDGRTVYRLTAPLKYGSDLISDEPDLQDMFDYGMVVVPAGFETDFASIPFPASKIYKPDGPWKKAAVVHDFLCGRGGSGLSRRMADNVFYEAMRADGVNLLVATAFWCYLRLWATVKDL